MLRLKRVFTQGFKEGGMPRIDSRIVMLVLLAIIGVPDSGVAGVRQCASHALNREDAAAAEAAARADLPPRRIFAVGEAFGASKVLEAGLGVLLFAVGIAGWRA
jgi:hypothetical protein